MSFDLTPTVYFLSVFLFFITPAFSMDTYTIFFNNAEIGLVNIGNTKERTINQYFYSYRFYNNDIVQHCFTGSNDTSVFGDGLDVLTALDFSRNRTHPFPLAVNGEQSVRILFPNLKDIHNHQFHLKAKLIFDSQSEWPLEVFYYKKTHQIVEMTETTFIVGLAPCNPLPALMLVLNTYQGQPLANSCSRLVIVSNTIFTT